MKKLIFIYDSVKFPEYGLSSLKNAISHSGCEVILLTNISDIKIDGLTVIDIKKFYSDIEFKNSNLYINSDKKFRNGFWYKVIERFLILQAYVSKYNIDSFYHAELDNLIFNLSGLDSRLDDVGKGIFVPKEALSRCIASLIYINEINSLKELKEYILSCKSYENDMQILNNFSNISKNRYKFFNLPTESCFNTEVNWEYLPPEVTAGLFDAAAFGQWLFGFDPANSYTGILKNKAINENINFSIEKLKFQFDKKNFYIIKNDKKIKLYNIHVHSKIHKKLSDEIYFEGIINLLNNGKSKIINFNLIKFLKFNIKNIIKRLIA